MDFYDFLRHFLGIVFGYGSETVELGVSTHSLVHSTHFQLFLEPKITFQLLMVLENTQSQKKIYIQYGFLKINSLFKGCARPHCCFYVCGYMYICLYICIYLNQSGAWFTAPKRWAVVGPTQLLGECGYCFNENLNMQELFYSLKCVLPYYAGNMQDRVIIIAR